LLDMLTSIVNTSSPCVDCAGLETFDFEEAPTLHALAHRGPTYTNDAATARIAAPHIFHDNDHAHTLCVVCGRAFPVGELRACAILMNRYMV